MAEERRAQLSQYDLIMLLFTRIAGLSYLFTICVSGQQEWLLQVLFSIALILLTTYSCYVTIRLRSKHDNKI